MVTEQEQYRDNTGKTKEGHAVRQNCWSKSSRVEVSKGTTRTESHGMKMEAQTCPIAMKVSSAVWWSSICKSPFVLNHKLQPECLAMACIIWSKKPIPVSISMTCDLDDWAACCAPFSPSWVMPETDSSSPPSRFIDKAILVSLVSRVMIALRMRWLEEAVALKVEGSEHDMTVVLLVFSYERTSAMRSINRLR